MHSELNTSTWIFLVMSLTECIRLRTENFYYNCTITWLLPWHMRLHLWYLVWWSTLIFPNILEIKSNLTILWHRVEGMNARIKIGCVWTKFDFRSNCVSSSLDRFTPNFVGNLPWGYREWREILVRFGRVWFFGQISYPAVSAPNLLLCFHLLTDSLRTLWAICHEAITGSVRFWCVLDNFEFRPFFGLRFRAQNQDLLFHFIPDCHQTLRAIWHSLFAGGVRILVRFGQLWISCNFRGLRFREQKKTLLFHLIKDCHQTLRAIWNDLVAGDVIF